MPLPDGENQLRAQLKRENTYTQAVKDRIGELVDKANPFKSTADTLRGRGAQIDKAVDDSVNDPTHVHFGGNPGSSTRNEDGSAR